MAEDKAKKLLLIVNPVSGKMAKRYMMKMINRFDEAGYSVTACCTQKIKMRMTSRSQEVPASI